jgi:PmbA protein
MNESELERLNAIWDGVLHEAKRLGAGGVEAEIGTGCGLTVTVRNGAVETVEHQRDKGLGVTVYLGRRKGNASSSDLGEQAVRDTVQAACTIARFASEDDCAGLIDPRWLATGIPDLDLHHPWPIEPAEAIALAVECEQAALSADARIDKSDGASLSTYSGLHFYANSHGFAGGWQWSSHTLDCAVIAGSAGGMQRDSWYSRARAAAQLSPATLVGREAARRTASRLDARRLATRRVPVIFEAPVASGLFSAFIGAISGGALYRRASFLQDRLGQPVFAPQVDIREQPHLLRAAGSAPFDGDGMATRERQLVAGGVLQGYVLSAYSARKLGMDPTGNADGVHNLVVGHGDQDLPALLRTMDRGLLVTDTIGFGINQVTGDYSRGVSGFWIEGGEVRYPVEEITVAGNLSDMYKRIVEIGNDVDTRGNIRTGSVLIEEMTIAGD